MGHIGDDIDPKGGDDPTLYGWRAARRDRAVLQARRGAGLRRGAAPQLRVGRQRRRPAVAARASRTRPTSFDGALPFMGGGDVVPFPATEQVKSGQPIALRLHVQRAAAVAPRRQARPLIDAMQPGGSGNPFDGLNSHEREELVYLYRQGFPFGDEFMIFSPMGQIWLWTSIADLLVEQDPTYFTNSGPSPATSVTTCPSAVEDDLIDVVTTVSKVITVQRPA